MYSGVFVPTPRRWAIRFDHLLRVVCVQNVYDRFYGVKRNIFNCCGCLITISSRLLKLLDVWLLDLNSGCVLCLYKTFVMDSVFQNARFFCLLLESTAHHD
jgi:hypothetical protein